MQTGTWTLVLNEFKATVPQKGTVCDCMIQAQSHAEIAGEMPIRDLQIDEKELKITDSAERLRLAQKYVPKSDDSKRVTIATVFPAGTALPQKFSEITNKDGEQLFSDTGKHIAKKTKVGEHELTEEELLEAVALLKKSKEPSKPETKK